MGSPTKEKAALIPKIFRTPGHEFYVDGRSLYFGDKRLYQRIVRRAKRTGRDIDEDFDEIIIASDMFASQLSQSEINWLANVLKKATRGI